MSLRNRLGCGVQTKSFFCFLPPRLCPSLQAGREVPPLRPRVYSDADLCARARALSLARRQRCRDNQVLTSWPCLDVYKKYIPLTRLTQASCLRATSSSTPP
jgi:hypothetical protein